jgi:signal transduction histidine kinase
MRHAQATTVTVTISAIGDTIRMEERAHAIGATRRIESSPGSGTRVIVEVQR